MPRSHQCCNIKYATRLTAFRQLSVTSPASSRTTLTTSSLPATMTRIPSLQPILHDPQAASSVITSPQALGFGDSPVKDKDKDSPNGRRAKRLSSTFEGAVGKLGRSISGRSSPNSPPAAGSHRRLFSLTRKGKGRDKSSDRVDGTYACWCQRRT